MAEASERAIALSYTPDLPAPMVVASGRGELARAIERIAREAGVPFVEDSDLAESLVELDIGTLIPPEYYRIIAELLVFVGRVAKDMEVES